MGAHDSEESISTEVLEVSVTMLTIQQPAENHSDTTLASPPSSPPASPKVRPSAGIQKWVTTKFGETAVQAKAVALRTRNQLQQYRVADLLDRTKQKQASQPPKPEDVPKGGEQVAKTTIEQEANEHAVDQPSTQEAADEPTTAALASDSNKVLTLKEEAANAKSRILALDVVPPPEDDHTLSDPSGSISNRNKAQYPSTITPRFVKKQHRLQNFQGLQHALQSAVSKTAAVWETGRLFDGGILTNANTKKWYKHALPAMWVKRITSEYERYGNYVIVRSSGATQWEDMPIYARIGMHIIFGSTFDRRLINVARIQKLFSTESIKQGHHFDAPASVAQIPHFIKTYKLNLDELEEPDPTKYATFNDFFYRKLRPDARPIAEPDNPDVIVSAADCRLSVFETIESATQIWIKGRQFTLEHLLQNTDLAAQYEGGSIAIFRLAPQDYHRFHSPVQGRVAQDPIFMGKQYFTVNPMAVRSDVNVFTDNVRKVTLIDLDQRKNRRPSPSTKSDDEAQPHHSSDKHAEDAEESSPSSPLSSSSPDEYELASAPFDQCVYVSIGALLVGSIQLTGAGKAGNELHKGDELGYFAYGGSTCLLLFKKGAVLWDEDLLLNSHRGLETLVRVGEQIGVRKN